MSFVLLLALSVSGQCSGGSCPAPSSYPAFSGYSRPAPVRFVPYQIAVRPAIQPVVQRAYGWHFAKYNGLTVKVWGWKPTPSTVEWEPELRENVLAVENARQAVKAAASLAPPPAAPAPNPVAVQPAQLNFGVDRSKIDPDRRYSGPDGQAILFDDKPDSPDIKSKMFLTVIGEPDDRKSVETDWKSHPSLKPLGELAWFRSFSPGDWQVKDDLGFHIEGKPTILLQTSGGKVLYRASDYTEGPEGLALAFAALRKPDPNYDPSKDPGPRNKKPVAPDDGAIGAGRIAAFLICAALVVCFLPARKPVSPP